MPKGNQDNVTAVSKHRNATPLKKKDNKADAGDKKAEADKKTSAKAAKAPAPAPTPAPKKDKKNKS